MSKNNKNHYRTTDEQPAVYPPHTTVEAVFTGPIYHNTGTFIITHESKSVQRPPDTIVFRGDIEQWIKENPQLYVTHITKL